MIKPVYFFGTRRSPPDPVEEPELPDFEPDELLVSFLRPEEDELESVELLSEPDDTAVDEGATTVDDVDVLPVEVVLGPGTPTAPGLLGVTSVLRPKRRF